MDNRANHYLLEAMGITQWVPRFSCEQGVLGSQGILGSQSILGSKQPIFCASCLVLLPQALEESVQEESTQLQMLMGMIKVLNLKSDEVCLAWVKNLEKPDNLKSLDLASLDQLSLVETLKLWAPYTLLVLGKKLQEKFQALPVHILDSLGAIIQYAAHPKELEISPQNKRKTYQDLLNLKEMIVNI